MIRIDTIEVKEMETERRIGIGIGIEMERRKGIRTLGTKIKRGIETGKGGIRRREKRRKEERGKEKEKVEDEQYFITSFVYTTQT